MANKNAILSTNLQASLTLGTIGFVDLKEGMLEQSGLIMISATDDTETVDLLKSRLHYIREDNEWDLFCLLSPTSDVYGKFLTYRNLFRGGSQPTATGIVRNKDTGEQWTITSGVPTIETEDMDFKGMAGRKIKLMCTATYTVII